MQDYLVVMTRFAIDPPILLQLVEDSRSIDPSHRLVAPNSIRSEALDLLLQRVRGGTLTEQTALELHERITGVKMRLLGDRVSRRTAWQIAREGDWSILTEAEYLAVAKLQADALITADPDLAAKATGIVPLAHFTDLFAD
jgi:predicted nucleic acid-binding protein